MSRCSPHIELKSKINRLEIVRSKYVCTITDKLSEKPKTAYSFLCLVFVVLIVKHVGLKLLPWTDLTAQPFDQDLATTSYALETFTL